MNKINTSWNDPLHEPSYFSNFSSRLTMFYTSIRSGAKYSFPELYLKFKTQSGSKIFTHTTPRERICIFEQAIGAFGLGLFIEIGSYFGATSVILAEVLRRQGIKGHSKLYCIDTWHNNGMSEGKRYTLDFFRKSVAPWSDYIVKVIGDSRRVPPPLDGEYDLLFIDGDHSYEACLSDAKRFSPQIRLGGKVVFHDHDPRFPGVVRTIGKMLESGDWCVSSSVETVLSLTRVRK